LIWAGRKQEYFCEGGWTGTSLICPSGMSGPRRHHCDVVPAKAGTHTPRPRVLARWPTASAPTDHGGYGSLLSQGRRFECGARPAPQGAVIPRHRVSPSASPMTGSSGVSSTLRLLDSITNGSGILDHPLSRMMTVGGVLRIQFSNSSSHSLAISPRTRASFAVNVRPAETQRAQGMPGARRARSLACSKKTRELVTTVTPVHPAFPAQWF
jgi:hypothetical protein